MLENPFQNIPKFKIWLRAWLVAWAVSLVLFLGFHAYDYFDFQEKGASQKRSLYHIEILGNVIEADLLRNEKHLFFLTKGYPQRCSNGSPVSEFERSRCAELKQEILDLALQVFWVPLFLLVLGHALTGTWINRYRLFRRSVKRSAPLGQTRIVKVCDDQGFQSWALGLTCFDVEPRNGVPVRVWMPKSFEKKMKKGMELIVYPVPNDSSLKIGLARHYAPHLSVR